MTKVVSPRAYGALREALCVVFWRKSALETYLRAVFQEHPELLSGISFSVGSKRDSVDLLMGRIMNSPQRYIDSVIATIVDLSAMEECPDLKNIREEADRVHWTQRAELALQEIRRVTAGFSMVQNQVAKREAAKMRHKANQLKLQNFAKDLENLKLEYLKLASMSSAQDRGREFEKLLNWLFELYDMEPRFAYNISGEQIDGAIRFDTDDYIMEAKWERCPVGLKEVNHFCSKIAFKGKNALGIFVSQSGFASTVLERYSVSTPFIGVSGEDLYFVLEGRVRLDDLLSEKKRYANKTGSCFLGARDLLTS